MDWRLASHSPRSDEAVPSASRNRMATTSSFRCAGPLDRDPRQHARVVEEVPRLNSPLGAGKPEFPAALDLACLCRELPLGDVDADPSVQRRIAVTLSTIRLTRNAIGPGSYSSPLDWPRSVAPSPLSRKNIVWRLRVRHPRISSPSCVRFVSTNASPGPITLSFSASDGIEKNGTASSRAGVRLVQIDDALPRDVVGQVIEDHRAVRRHDHLLLGRDQYVDHELDQLRVDPVLDLVATPRPRPRSEARPRSRSSEAFRR